MDECALLERNEDTMENESNEGHASSAKDADPPTEDTPNRVGVFCCRDCGEAFREEAAYLEHCNQHPQDNLHSDNQSHSGEKDRGSPYFCTLCSLSFVELNEFNLHKNNHEQIPLKESGGPINTGKMNQRTYECPDCGKRYGVLGRFLNHQRTHRPPAKSLFHDLEHLKKRPFQCETCGRNYSRASALDAHRRCHEQKLVKSTNKSLGDATEMRETVAESVSSESQAANCSENPFKCVCGKAFSTLPRLKTHRRFTRNSQCASEEFKQKTKKSYNEFSCHECHKVFSGHTALVNHQRWHANQSSKDSSKKFACEECGKVFTSLTFYYRHQRMAHSEDIASKSFLHQVCQLQKKAFECKDCGVKFSRASALHSHQLIHADAFGETEKRGRTCSDPPTEEKVSERDQSEMEHLQICQEAETEQESLCPAGTAEESHVNESEDDMESYEPGDFNVQVISASESEGEEVQDTNPDLELLCESDQEGRDDGDAESFLNKSGMDLNIVQIDFEQGDEPTVVTTKDADDKERFHCPDCYRWFYSPSSLRMHRTWHGGRKKKHHIEETKSSIECEDCGLKFEHTEDYETHLHQHALEEEDGTAEDSRNSEAGLVSWTVEEGEDDVSCSGLKQVPSDVCSSAAFIEPRNFYTCSVCGKIYIYQVSFIKHLKLHERPAADRQPKSKPPSESHLPKYECSDCGMSFIRKTRLLSHVSVHRSRQAIQSSIPGCEQCNRTFNSVKSWMAHVDLHKQKPFWCLSCALGFLTEESLDKHLQNHSLKQSRRPKRLSLLKRLPQTKPFKCSICGKSFCRSRKLFSHRRKKHKWLIRRRDVPNGDSASVEMVGETDKEPLFPNIKEETVENTDMVEMARSEESVRENENEHPQQFDDDADPEKYDSDCGEPLHCLRIPKPPDSTGSDQSQTNGIDGDMHNEHKYWKWECFDCDMGFDEMAGLHLHYIKHATGEIPMIQDDGVEA